MKGEEAIIDESEMKLLIMQACNKFEQNERLANYENAWPCSQAKGRRIVENEARMVYSWWPDPCQMVSISYGPSVWL